MKRKHFYEMTGHKLPENMLEKEIIEKSILHTSLGTVKFYGPCTKEELENFNMDSGLNNFRQAKKQYEALKYIAGEMNGLVFIASHRETIISYLVFLKPEYPRWAKAAENELPELLELGAIEVSMMWRDEGLGKGILKYAINNYDFEKHIIISIEAVCNWKNIGPDVSLWEYREMVRKVLGHIGLEPRETDEPEVLEHPANMLTARIGEKVSQESVEKFEKLLKKNKKD